MARHVDEGLVACCGALYLPSEAEPSCEEEFSLGNPLEDLITLETTLGLPKLVLLELQSPDPLESFLELGLSS